MLEMSVEQKAKLFDLAVAQGRVNPEDLNLLTDFKGAMVKALNEELTYLKEPVWTNTKTGQPATSLFAILRVLGTEVANWNHATMEARRYRSHHVRRDLPKRSPFHPTHCIDIRDAEDWIISTLPRKGPKLVDRFKDVHGVA